MWIWAQARILRVHRSRGQREEQGGKGRGGESNQADSDTAAIGARWSGTVGRSSG